MERVFYIYTDGACRVHTTKAGSWAYVIVDEDDSVVDESSNTVSYKTTSHRMELLAAVKSIEASLRKTPGERLVVYCDNEVVVKGITIWVHNWKSNNWRRGNGKSVQHKPLWKRLYSMIKDVSAEFIWVKAHDGNKWNEYVHELCEKALQEYESITNKNQINE